MSIDVTLQTARKERFSESLSHNLSEMAVKAHLYNPIWSPTWYRQVNGLHNLTPRGGDLIAALSQGLAILRANPETYRDESGLHNYLRLVEFAENYLAACRKWPDALVTVT